MRISRLNLVGIICTVAMCMLICACGNSNPPQQESNLNLGLKRMTGQNVDDNSAPGDNNETSAVNAQGEGGIGTFDVFDEDKLYSGSNKIDPFLPLIKSDAPAEDGEDGEKRAPVTPLERFDLGQLKLSAVVETAGGNSAVIVESSGRGYVVRPGAYIGLNGGQITEIKSDRVVIEEPIGKNERGEAKINIIELILPKPAGAF